MAHRPNDDPGAESIADFRRVADDLPWLIWTHRPDGIVDWANRAWFAFAQLPVEIATSETGWLRVVHPAEFDALVTELREAIVADSVLEIELRLRPATGSDDDYRWFAVRSLPRFDGEGKLAYRLGSAVDIHDVRTRREQHARSFQSIAQGIPEIIWTATPAGDVDWWNARWYEYTGQSDDLAFGWGWRAVTHRDDFRLVADVWMRSIASGEPYQCEARICGADGEYRWFLNRAVAQRNLAGEIERWCGTCVDIDDARRARAREQLYARMTEEMSAALSLDETLAAVTRLVVPEFGDFALVNLVKDGQPMCVAGQHRDPRMQAVLQCLIGRCYSHVDAQRGTRAILANGRATLFEHVDADLWATILPEFLPTFEQLGMESAIGVPLVSKGQIVGSLTAVMSKSGRTMTADDTPLFAEIARRIAPAIRNAEIYEREVRVAQSFQRAAMVQQLPHVPGLHFDAIYQAAEADATVGGDWYDAVRLPDGRVVLSIGDVAGSGLDAAVTMASVRQSIRTAALINPDPALILEAVDRIVRALAEDKFVTACVALLDPVTLKFRYASAGHPPPLLRLPDGTMRMLESQDLPLGLRGRELIPTVIMQLEAGSLVVMYTDGLTEFDRNPIAGESALRRAAHATSPATAARDIYAAIALGRAAQDDVAVFSIALEAAVVDADDGAHGARWTFASHDAIAANAARTAYGWRLRDLGIPEEDVIAAELIFAELIGNAYRYAPGNVDVLLDTSTAAPVLHVLDRGGGFEYRPRLPVDILAENGRGLFLVRALSEEVSAERRVRGGSHVRVVLASRSRTRSIASLGRGALV